MFFFIASHIVIALKKFPFIFAITYKIKKAITIAILIVGRAKKLRTDTTNEAKKVESDNLN